MIADNDVNSWATDEADSLKKVSSRVKSYHHLQKEWFDVDFWGPSLQPGKHYRHYLCLRDLYFQDGSSAGCTILDLRLDDEFSYNVSVNGIFFTDRIDCSETKSWGDRFLCQWLHEEVSSGGSRHIILTPLNGNCTTKHVPITARTVMRALLVTGLTVSYYFHQLLNLLWHTVPILRSS